jgi:hypothetical protein
MFHRKGRKERKGIEAGRLKKSFADPPRFCGEVVDFIG